MSIYNKGCIDRNIVDSFIKLISETYVYRIKPIDKKKEEEVYTLFITSIENIPNNGGSEQDVADMLCMVASSMQMEYYVANLIKRAYDEYKQQHNYHGIIYCGACIAEFEIRRNQIKSETERNLIIKFIRENLSLIEDKDGRRDDYYYFIKYGGILKELQQQEYQKYIPEFVTDCTPTDDEEAIMYYGDICDMIRIMYNKHISQMDPEHMLWFDSYIKYKSIELSFREKMGVEKYNYGLLYLGAFYSVEYSNSGNIEYYNKAKSYLSKIFNGQYFPDAQEKLKTLEKLFLTSQIR